ncbi:hypothetical protein [Moraxella lacunata]|uniref:hypothetical protein n=1 Tax=Moraxella lacunata TaxID=477 RepID=UPI003EE259C0
MVWCQAIRRASKTTVTCSVSLVSPQPLVGDFYTQKYSSNHTPAINMDTTCPYHDLFCP